MPPSGSPGATNANGRTDAWDPPIVAEFLERRRLCAWGKPHPDGIVEDGARVSSEGEWCSRKSQLLSEGWTELAEPAGFLDGPDLDRDGNLNQQGVIWARGVLYYALAPELAPRLAGFGTGPSATSFPTHRLPSRVRVLLQRGLA